MNYTENYHLPQWEKEDRILRMDFNRMCADIEGGLTETSQETKDVRRGSNTQYEKSWNRITKLAYNHYCLMENMTESPWQTGVFHQNPARNPEGVGGTALWDGVCFAGNDKVILSKEMLAECLEPLTELKTVKNNPAASTPLTAVFRAPAMGQWKTFALTGSYSNAVINDKLRIRVSLTNSITGIEEQAQEAEMIYVAESAAFHYPFSASLSFASEVDYLITIQPLEANCTMQAELNVHTNTLVTTNRAKADAITASHKFCEQEPGSGGMAVIRCLITGEGGKLSFRWDGVERTPDAARIARAGGRGWQEFIYLRDDEIPADSEMSLRLEGGERGNVLLYDWGALLL